MGKGIPAPTGWQHLTGNQTRRDFFGLVSDGIYGVALASLLCRDLYGSTDKLASSASILPETGHRSSYDLKPRAPHFEPKAKAVIQLFMNGGPGQMDLFDPKPKLSKHEGETPEELRQDDGFQVLTENTGLLGSPFKFAQHGKSGIWLSEVMPHLAEVVDDIAVIRSMYAPSPVHSVGLYVIQTGLLSSRGATMGAWTTYGLGSINQNLPAFVVLDDALGLPTPNGVENWQSGFLPPIYQGTRLRSTGAPVLDLRPEVQDPPEMVKLGRDLLTRLNSIHKQENPGQPLLDARISNYELAARMQLEASSALDLSGESEETLSMYGVGLKPKVKGIQFKNPGPDNFARRCIMARRLIERGVRYVQVCNNSQIWDTHISVRQDLGAACDRTDQPVTALLKDLKRRGLLDSTLVVWGGEFGRLPFGQNHEGGGADNPNYDVGRDHNGKAFSMWLAGGGIKGGTVYGGTDDLGLKSVDHPVSIGDLHATILHQLGLDHQKLFFEVDGKRQSFAPPEARVVKEILA